MKPDKCPYDTGNARMPTESLKDQATCLIRDCEKWGKYFSCYFPKSINEVVEQRDNL